MIAFIFPGQGAQKVGMGKALADAFPICRDTFAEAVRRVGERAKAFGARRVVPGRLASEGVTTYVEVGPGTTLGGLVRKIHREATSVSFGSPDDLAAVELAINV